MKKFFRLVSMFALAGATLAYTGCTDYDEDIDKINDRIDALETGKLKSLEDQVASLQTTVKSLEDAQKAASEALKTLENKHDADVKTLNNAIEGVKGEIAKINESLANYVTKTYADATYATKKSVEDALVLIGNLETALESVPTSAEVKAAQDAANAAQTDATKALGDIKALKEALGVYAEAGKLDEALKAKLDIAGFDAKFDEQLDKALAEDGKITTAIAEAIEAATAEINTKIAILQADVKDLANRIQSLVFVPEYNDGKASANIYYFADGNGNASILSKDIAVKGTFKVTPEKLAPAVAKYALDNLVKVYAVSTKTRAASADLAATSVEVTVAEDAAKTGRLEVSAVFAAKDFSEEGNAIALYVNNPDSELTEGEKEEEKLDTKTYFSSAYVPVDMELVNLFDSYVLYNGTKEYAAEKVEKQWSEWKGTHTFAAGYVPYLKIEGKYYTPAQVEEMYTLPEGSLVPTPVFNFVYTDAKGVVLKKNAQYTAITEAVKNGYESTVEMAAPSKEKAMDYVGYQMTSEVGLQFTLKNSANKNVKVAAKSYESSYKIIRRQIDIVIEPESVAWTYENAVKLSSAKTAAALYDQPIDKEFDKKFSELDVDMPVVDVKEIDLKTILEGTVTAKHKLNGTAVTGVTLAVDHVAILKHKIASVAVSKYAFSNKTNVYEFCNTYANDPTQTDVNVKFNLTLGAVPVGPAIDLGEQTIDYLPRVSFHDFAEDATVKAAFTKVADYFADYATFKGDITAQAPVKVYDVAKKTNVKPNTDVTEYTQFAPMGEPQAGHNYYIRLSQADVASYADTYSFQTTYKTWYGVNYVFKATAKLEQPSVRIDYFQDWVDTAEDGSRFATLKGKVENGAYVIDTDDLSKYFFVEGVADSKIAPEHITVEYNVLTVADEKKGIENVPVPTSPATVNAEGHISESEIAWKNADGDYSAQELEVEAVLKVNGIAVNTKEITLKIADPIVGFTSETINVDRVPYVEKVVNLWSAMKVYGANKPATNLVKNDAKDFASMWNFTADAVYGLELTFDPESYTVVVGGVDKTAAYAGKIVYDEAAQTITYKADSAEQVEPVYVSIEATLTHKYGYMGLENHKVIVNVVFNEPAE